MQFQKIAGPMRIDSGSGSAEYPLRPKNGGSRCKVVQYMIKVLDASATTADLGLRIEHSPDGAIFATHTTSAAADIGSKPVLKVYDGDMTKIVGEFIRPVILTGASGSEWLIVEIYEMRKPF